MLAVGLLLGTTTVGHPILCIEADGALRLEPGLAIDGCCADDPGERPEAWPTVSDGGCGCSDSDVALTARPIDPWGGMIASAARGITYSAWPTPPIVAAANARIPGLPPSVSHGVVLQL